METCFGITGRIPSKKNGKRILRGRGGVRFIGSSKSYGAWEREHVAELADLRLFPAPLRHCTVAIAFTAGDRIKFDLTNKAESVMDLLVLAGVIEDDNADVVPSVTLTLAGYEKGKFYAKVTITHGES